MPLLEAVRLALQQIRVQKLKSFFTALGVLIGVTFLIAVISIVQGMSNYLENDFAGKLIGGNTFTLRRFSFIGQGNVTEAQWRRMQQRPRVTTVDVDVLRSALPAGTQSAIDSEEFVYGSTAYARPRQVQAVATDGDFFRIKKYDFTSGRAFTPQEASLGLPVIVIGDEVRERMFPSVDPVGRALKINGIPYTVVGVIAKQGSVFGFSLDRIAVAPFKSPISRLTNPRGDVDGLIVSAPSREQLGELQETTREVLRSRRRLPPGAPDDFAFETSESALAFFAGIQSKMLTFGTALPLIGLVVGSLVIMNIMLVAVAERTREIGVRKALGARRRDILSQFLVEAAVLSLIGAAVGIALGIGGAKLLSAAFPFLPSGVAPWSIAAALVMGAGVGIAAGAYPASRASRLDPITALRAE